MALVIYAMESTSKFFLLAAIIYFLYRVVTNNNRNDEVLLGAAYVMGFEVLSRMTGGAFSYEFAKYAVMGFMGIGILYKGIHRGAWPYVLFILCLAPGIFFSAMNLDYETNVANAIGFNLSGPMCLAITALYCYNRKMPENRFKDVLLAALLPILSTTAYLYIYTPNIRDTLSGTASNFAASGGYGPNQVATILGLGMLILFVRLFTIKDKLTNGIDLALLAFVGYRAVVTFSRGGVITALICAVAFLGIYLLQIKASQRKVLIPRIIIIVGVMAITWLITSISTLGLIDKRYSNQDAAGRLKDDISTGRQELIDSEIEAFLQNPITGVGIGKAKEFRLETTGRLSATHNEVSRTLSEHGLFGIFSLLILLLTPLFFRLKNRTNYLIFACYIFWIFTINHSAMRIAASAFVYGLGLIVFVKNVKKTAVHRK